MGERKIHSPGGFCGYFSDVGFFKLIKIRNGTDFVNSLVDLFSDPNVTTNFKFVKRNLLGYYSLLQSSHLSNSVLSSLPLPRSLDPNTVTTVPSRLYTLLILFRDSVSALIQLPFFLFPLVVHTPVYIMGRFGARLAEHEEETQAQNKVVFGLLSLLLIYPATFFFLWALLWYTPIGAVVAAVSVYLFAVHHNRMIDSKSLHPLYLLTLSHPFSQATMNGMLHGCLIFDSSLTLFLVQSDSLQPGVCLLVYGHRGAGICP